MGPVQIKVEATLSGHGLREEVVPFAMYPIKPLEVLREEFFEPNVAFRVF